jgi:hypothetical protein
MICHVCEKPAVGQCMECWRFYCPVHGVDSRCVVCRQRAEERRIEGERVLRAMGRIPLSDAVIGEFGTTRQLTAEEEAEIKRRQMDGLELRRVVPIVQSQPWGDGVITLIALEIYEDGSILTFQSVFPTGSYSSPSQRSFSSNLEKMPDLRIGDDIGTRYFVGSGGGGGGWKTWRGYRQVTPAIPEEAQALTISVRHMITNHASTGPTAPELRFEVSL